MATRQCPFCGKVVADYLTQCPFCRDALPAIPVARSVARRKSDEIRRGLLYMLLAAVIHYFSAGYSAMRLPFPINPLVTVWLSPALFMGGLFLMCRGFYLRSKT